MQTGKRYVAAIVSTSSYGALARGIVEGLDDAPSSSSFLHQKTPDPSISPKSMYHHRRGLPKLKFVSKTIHYILYHINVRTVPNMHVVDMVWVIQWSLVRD